MNAQSIVARVQRRIPGYDPVLEYLDEVNAAYKEVWDYICQLEDSYFNDIKLVTVAAQASEFDFLYNASGNLSSPISGRYFQIQMIRINQPGDTNFYPALPRPWNDQELLAQKQDSTQPVATGGPYLYTLFAKGSVKFGRPLPVNAQIEVTYNFIFMPLAMVSAGTVTSAGSVVTGTGSNFTQMLPADFQTGFPGNDQDTDVGMELILGGNQTYRVKTLTTDTALTTVNPIVPAVTAAGYVLASVPDTPEGHHNVISTVATRNFLSTPADDPRFKVWAGLAEKELGAMRDSVMPRQKQAPPQRKRFPFGLSRSFQTPGSSR